MPYCSRIPAMAGAALLVAAQALAQTSLPLTLTPEHPPRWDAAAGAGLFYLRERRAGDAPDAWNALGEIRFDAGRYWTTHLKTEIGVSLPQSWGGTDFQPVPVAGLPFGGYATMQKDLRITTLSPGLTYQFLENAFAHPYVSTGLRLSVLNTHSHRYEETRTQNGISYTVPAFDHRATAVLARPFVAAGFKSYFNDRTFVRTEGLIALDQNGAAQMTLRLGFGVDF